MGGKDELPRVSAGKKPKSYPVRCSHCGHKLNNLAEFQTHMRVSHPA